MENKAEKPSAEAVELSEIGMHPLENPVVLKRLFQIIPFKTEDFRSFRLVSRAWNQCSLPIWRKNAWLILQDLTSSFVEEENDSDYEDVDSDDDDDFTDEDTDFDDDEDYDSEGEEEMRGITRQKYIKLLASNELQLAKHPFRKYIMRCWEIDLGSVNHNRMLSQCRFWNRVGRLITHLDLSFCSFVGASFRNVLFGATPNLQSLTLFLNTYPDQRPADLSKRLDLRLPQHGRNPVEKVQTNLVELNIHLASSHSFPSLTDEEDEEDSSDDDKSSSNFEDELVEHLPVTWIEFFIHFPNIKKIGSLNLGLDIFGHEACEFFTSLEKLRNKHGPRYLAGLNDLNMFFPEGLIRHIFEMKFPLKRLTLCIRPDLDEMTLKPLLKYRLEYLSMERIGATSPFRNFPFGLKFPALKELVLFGYIAPNLMFLKDCPNLEVLSYTPFYEGRLDVDLKHVLSNEKLPRLEKMWNLKIDGDGCSAAEIMKLGEIMPNLRRLEVGLDNESFRAVCRVWKGLEQLTIAPFWVGEEGLLGMDERGGEKFCNPNLTHLGSLKCFKVEDVRMSRDQRGLTNAGILEGIMALPSLEVVELCISSEVTLEVRNQLEKRFSKCSISIQEETQGGKKSEVFAAALLLERSLRLEPL